MQPTPVEPVPVPPIPVDPADPPPRTRGGLWWWIVVGSVALAATVVAGVVIALQRSSPSSADELASLLVVPKDRTTNTVKITIEDQPRAGSSTQGVRWSVSQTWNDQGGHSGIVSLTQYQTEEQAKAALARVAQATPGARHDVPGHPDAFFAAGKPIGLLGLSIQAGGGAGVKGTVVASVFATSEDPAFLQQLLTQQLDRLP
jgi:hypothetical protein